MALTTTVVSGRVPLPNDANPANAEVIFTLTGYDTDLAIIIPEPVTATPDAGGNILISLWPNTRGLRGTQYTVKVKFADPWDVRQYDLGKITVSEGGILDFEDLIDLPAPAALSGAVILTKAAYDLLAPPDPDTFYLVTV